MPSSLRLKISAFAFVFLALFCVPASSEGLESLAPSTSEDVAIAFYRQIATMPDFHRWAAASDAFKDTDAVNRDVILMREMNRLKRKYYQFNPAARLLTIEIPVMASLTEVLEATNRPYLLRLDPIQKDVDYFPYTIADTWIALIVNDWEKSLAHRLEPWQSTALKQAFPQIGHRPLRINLRIHVKVRDADAKAPVLIDGEHQWLMLADVASMTIWQNDRFIWEYQADWYETPAEAELKKLYRE